MEPLKDETDLLAAKLRLFLRRKPPYVLSQDFHASGVGREDASEDGEQRGLAAAGRTDQVNALAAPNVQLNVPKHRRGVAARPVALGHA